MSTSFNAYGWCVPFRDHAVRALFRYQRQAERWAKGWAEATDSDEPPVHHVTVPTPGVVSKTGWCVVVSGDDGPVAAFRTFVQAETWASWLRCYGVNAAAHGFWSVHFSEPDG